MEKITDIIYVLSSMPCYVYFSLAGLLGAIYLVFIGPFLFRFWIIPKIENRYNGVVLKFDNPAYTYVPFSNWGSPPIEISVYILCKYMGWEIPLTKNSHAALKKINYDISTASRTEIVMSFITVFIIIYLIIAGLAVAIVGK